MLLSNTERVCVARTGARSIKKNRNRNRKVTDMCTRTFLFIWEENGDENAQFTLSVPIGRRVLLHGLDRFVEAFSNVSPGCVMDDWLEGFTENMSEEDQHNAEGIVLGTLCTYIGFDDCSIRPNVFKSMLDGENPFSNVPPSISAKDLVYCALHLFTCVGGVCDAARGTLEDMGKSDSIMQTALAKDVLDEDRRKALEQTKSFGWWAIRRVWFPAWKVQHFMWKLSTPKRYAPDGFAQTVINARESGDEHMAKMAKRALKCEILERLVRRKLGAQAFAEMNAEVDGLVDEIVG